MRAIRLKLNLLYWYGSSNPHSIEYNTRILCQKKPCREKSISYHRKKRGCFT